MFSKILIANRGEIACRVIRACRKLGITSVAVYSEADANAQHVRQADEAWPIGGPRPQDSYLRGETIIDVARRSGAQAIHPGYGFLSENADFAEAVEAAGLVFIGPKAASMRKMGSKAGAKELMQAQGVPVVPGYTGSEQDAKHLQQQADRIGYPLMIKAAHGGGGKGMRIVRKADDFAAALESCQREAAGAFGRDRVLLERYIEQPRHIEIQVFGDSHGQIIHLGERECSAQRRYQKVIEESPSPFLSPAMRTRMGEAAVAAARAIDYVNAGTVEFIVDANNADDAGDGFYFMEINTRLQVEHPVTELVTGLDLVEWQLRVASGEPLPLSQDAITHCGHAIEVRLYAEDPAAGFLPGSGKLETLRLPPPSPQVRIDTGVIEGDTVTIFYDPMIAKMIVFDQDRPRALARLREALAESDIAGPKSNIEFLEKLIRHPVVVEGTIDTSYLDAHLDEVLPAPAPLSAQQLAAAASLALLHDEAMTRAKAASSADPYSPWAHADGWRHGHAGEQRLCLRLQSDRNDTRAERIELTAHGYAGDYRIETPFGRVAVQGARQDGLRLSARYDHQARSYQGHADSRSVFLHDGDHRWRFERQPAFLSEVDNQTGHEQRLRAPMPGRIVAVKVSPGDTVASGQEVLVMEAMKMELSLKAPSDGRISVLQVAVGDFVEADAVLLEVEA